MGESRAAAYGITIGDTIGGDKDNDDGAQPEQATTAGPVDYPLLTPATLLTPASIFATNIVDEKDEDVEDKKNTSFYANLLNE